MGASYSFPRRVGYPLRIVVYADPNGFVNSRGFLPPWEGVFLMKNSFIASLALSISALAVGVLAPGCGSDEDPATPPDDPSGVGGGGPSASTGVGGGGPSASTGTMSGQTSSQASGGMGGAAGSSGASSTSGTGGEGGSPPSLPPVCSPSCQSAADCAAGYPPGSSHDEDNWTCSGGACVYTGCKSTAECKVLFPNQNYTCH